MAGTFVAALVMLIVGAVSALVGYKLFRILLPLLGLIVGFVAGFTGVQSLFGKNVFSFVVALVIALVVAVAMAALSYFFYTVGIIVLSGAVGAGLFGYIATSVFSLSDNGFVTGMLSLSGAIIFGLAVFYLGLERDVVIVLSSMVGIGMILVGVFLIASDLSLEDIHDQGLGQTISNVVTTSFFWFLAWLGGTFVATLVQARTSAMDFYGDEYILTSE